MKQFGMIAGVLGVVLAVAGFFMSARVDRFFQAYLVAYTFWMGVVLGSLALLMVQHLSGGVWGIVLRRPFEAAVRTLPFMAVLFLPISFGMHSLYEWIARGHHRDRPDHRGEGALPEHAVLPRRARRSTSWCGATMGYLLTKWSAEHDRTGDPALLDKLERVSGGGLVVYFLTVTFAMVDWTMSVNPHWFSTIWGMLYIGGQGLSAFAFGICVLVMLSQTAPLNRVLTTHHFHDLGKFLFAFLMLWAYLSFSQFLIIWSANIPEEIPHYLDRWDNSWKYLSIFIIVGHFIVPYCAAAVARPEEELGQAARHRDVDPVRAPGRLLLARRARAPQGRLHASACSTSRCRWRSAAFSSRCSCRSWADARCCRSTIRAR